MSTPSAAPYAFVSYASADRERALAVAAALEGAGRAVWLDRRNIAGGTSWSAEIVAGVEGCAALLLLVSPAAMASPNVAQEVQLAWEGRRPILPLLLAPAEPPPALRYALAGRQRVELLDRPTDAWRADLLRALTGLGLDRATPAGPPAFEAPVPATPATPASPPTNLPRQLTSFVGREAALAAVADLLRSAALVTLTGVGGTGKTRLALAVAEQLVLAYPDGVWLVELAPLADPVLVPQAVAAVLGVREQPGEALTATLAHTLQRHQLLLILDNCEHLIDASARLADDLLRACPGLRILATSREQLGVPGEAAYRVPSLALPAPDADPAILATSEAVRLFVARAQAARPGFALTDANTALVAQVCARLDGIPLALELAAARLRALPLDQVAARLDDRFRLLTGGSRTALPRQQTLQATLDWSYRLLGDDERALLRRLSVFAGGCTLDAAEAVCADEQIAAWRVLDLLTGLADKSLVILDETSSEARYRLLETVRQYAQERLAETDEGTTVRDRHRDWCLTLVEATDPLLTTGAQLAGLTRLDTEMDNLRAALGWCQSGDAARGLQLAVRLERYWTYRARDAEGIAWLTSFVERVPDRPDLRAEGLSRLGGLLWGEYRDLARAQAVLEESVALGRTLDAPRTLLYGLYRLSFVLLARRGPQARAAVVREALLLSRRCGDHWFEAALHRHQADDAYLGGDLARAQQGYEAGLVLIRSVGDPVSTGHMQLRLALCRAMTGQHDRAAALIDEVAREFGEAEVPAQECYVWLWRSEAAWMRGAIAAALAAGERARALCREQQVWDVLPEASAILGRACAAAGDPDRAADLLTAACAQPGIHLGRARRWLARAARRNGDLAGAIGHLRAALRLHRDRGEWIDAPGSLDAAADTLLATGAARPAARLLGAGAAARRARDLCCPPFEQDEAEGTATAARAILGDEVFADARAAGAALPLEGAVEEALALLDGLIGAEEVAP